MQSSFVDLSRLVKSNTFIPNAFIFERDDALEIGLFDDSLEVLGDWDFNLRFCMRYDIAVVQEALAFYHLRPLAQGVDGNSIHVMKDRHAEYRELLKNRWLRRDLSSGGLGVLIAYHEHQIAASVQPQKPSKKRSHKTLRAIIGFGRLLCGRGGTSLIEILRVFRFAGFKGLRRALREIGR
jgi:hypothetical protein